MSSHPRNSWKQETRPLAFMLRLPMLARLLLALLSAPVLVSAFASAAVAQNVTFSIRLAYTCTATPTVPGCDAYSEQATFTTLQAPANGTINLTQQNGGKGVLSTFWLIERRNGADITLACADGSDLILYTNKIFTQNNDYFSCTKLTVTGAGLNLTLSTVADGAGGVSGTAQSVAIKGGYRFMARHIDTLVSQEYVTRAYQRVASQNKWDFCAFTGFEDFTPAKMPTNGCVLRPGVNDNNPWTLEALTPGALMQCHAVCMSRLPE